MSYGLPPPGPYGPPPPVPYGPPPVCPQCGSSANVHAIQELAALAQLNLDRLHQGPPAMPPPGYPGRPHAGWQDTDSGMSGGSATDLAEDVAGEVLAEGMRLIGRAIGRRVRRSMEEKVMPALAAQAEAHMREQIEVAQRHPDLRACLDDQVAFLAGGHATAPLPDLQRVTVAAADALVAQLRGQG
jgi:hypothetical protein